MKQPGFWWCLIFLAATLPFLFGWGEHSVSQFKDAKDIVIVPRRTYRDPFRGGDNVLVLADTYQDWHFMESDARLYAAMVLFDLAFCKNQAGWNALVVPSFVQAMLAAKVSLVQEPSGDEQDHGKATKFNARAACQADPRLQLFRRCSWPRLSPLWAKGLNLFTKCKTFKFWRLLNLRLSRPCSKLKTSERQHLHCSCGMLVLACSLQGV